MRVVYVDLVDRCRGNVTWASTMQTTSCWGWEHSAAVKGFEEDTAAAAIEGGIDKIEKASGDPHEDPENAWLRMEEEESFREHEFQLDDKEREEAWVRGEDAACLEVARD